MCELEQLRAMTQCDALARQDLCDAINRLQRETATLRSTITDLAVFAKQFARLVLNSGWGEGTLEGDWPEVIIRKCERAEAALRGEGK